MATHLSDQPHQFTCYSLWPGAISIGYVLAQWLTLGHYPEVWVDEVAYTDPAWNWANGLGFVSRAWPNQPSGEYWAGNVPLHAWLLGCWLAIWGSSESAVRLFGVVCTAIGLGLWPMAASRLFPKQPIWPWWGFGLLLAANGQVWWLARSGRPEPLAFLLLALAIWVWAGHASREQLFLLVFLGMLLIWTGLYWLVPLLFLLVYAHWFVLQLRVKSRLLALGAFLGIGVLLVWYAAQGVIYPFLINTLLSSHTVTGNIAQSLAVEGAGLTKVVRQLEKILDFPHLYGQDMGWLLGATVVGTGLLLHQVKKVTNPYHKAIKRLLVTALLLPLGLQMAGKFAYYYLWIGLLPLYGALTLILSGWYAGMPSKKAWVILPLYLAILVGGFPWKAIGRPANCSTGCRQWAASAPVSGTDGLYVAYPFYYELKKKTPWVYLPNYSVGKRVGGIPESEAQSIRFALVAEPDKEATFLRLGGQWETVTSCPCEGQPMLRYVLFERKQ